MNNNSNISHTPRKRFGQHFLHDKTIIQRIVAALAAKPGEHLIEIGPGLGALTLAILPLAGTLEVVELDRDLIPKLIASCQPYGDLIVHQADALRFDFAQLTTINSSLRIVGNLPYNITTPLLFHLLNYAPIIRDMLFMIQKEVAERITAKAGDEAYGRLSVMVQYYCQPEILFFVKPGSFTPPPKVDSAIIYLQPFLKPPFIAHDFNLFAEIVRVAFNQRRKTLRNSLRSIISEQQLKDLEIDPELRAERLSVQDYVAIANYLNSNRTTLSIKT